MTARKGKRAASKQAEDTENEEANALSETISRALESAKLADDAAHDVEAIRGEHEAFVEKVQKTSKTMAALGVGAAIGASLAMIMSGLVYFRSVKDLRENAELQAEAFAQLVQQTAALNEVVVQAGNQQGDIRDDITVSVTEALLETGDRISDEIASFANDSAGFEPQFASGITTEVQSQIEVLTDEMKAAMADLELSLTEVITTGGASGSAGGAVTDELKALIEELRKASAEIAVQKATPAPAPRSTSTASNRSTTRARPAPRPAPNPFSFP